MARVLLIEPRGRLARFLADRLRAGPGVAECRLATWPALPELDDPAGGFDAVVYHPPARKRRAAVPDLNHARDVLRRCAAGAARRVVLLASTAVYGPHCHNQGLMTEEQWGARHRRNRVARAWAELEELAQ